MFEKLIQVVDPNSKIYIFISLTANIGTIIALCLTIKSIQKAEKQNRRDSAQKSLDVAFKTIYASLDAVTFITQFPGSADFYTGRDAIYRVHALPHLYGLSSNKTNYRVIKNYLGLLRQSINVIFTLSKELGNEKLRSFYLEKLKVEEVFLHDILYELVQKLLAHEQNEEYKQTLLDINLDISDILAGLK